MENNKDLKEIFKTISDSALLNFSSSIREDKLNIVREILKFDIDSYLESMSMLLYDVKNGYYKNVDNKTVWSIALFFIYIICPEDLLEPFIGKKNFIKSFILFSFSFINIKKELDKYRESLDKHKVETSNEFGKIIYYNHREEYWFMEELWRLNFQ